MDERIKGWMLLGALAVSLTVVSCSGDSGEDRKSEKAESSVEESAGAEVPEPVALPELAASLSVNRMADARVPRGWPVNVRAVLYSKAGLELENPAGPWEELLSLEVRDAAGNRLPWEFTRGAGEGESVLRLGPETPAGVSWTLSSPEKIEPGTYELFLRIKSGREEALRGPHRIEILDAVPESLKPEEKFLRLLEAESRLALGDTDGAVKTLDAYLSENKNDLDAITLKAKILTEAGRGKEALAALNRMLEAFPDDAAPPEELVRERNRLMIESLKARE